MLKVAVAIKFYKGEISPFDKTCIEMALGVENAEIFLISMGPKEIKENLEYFTRLGNVRAILISDDCYKGSDTLVTAKILSSAIEKIKPDIILCGRQSINGDTAQVPAQISTILGYNFYPYTLDFSFDKVKTRFGDFDLTTPALISLDGIKQLRFANIFSKKKEVEIWTNEKLRLDESKCGIKGSFTKVISVLEKSKKERKCKFIGYDDLDGIIKKSLSEKKEAEEKLSSFSDGKIDRVVVVGEGLKIADEIAEEVVRIPFTTVRKTAIRIKDAGIKYILFSAGLQNRAIAPRIAVELDCGLCADCIGIKRALNELRFLRPANCENVIAEISIEGKFAMATVREKEDSVVKVVFGIGYGAKDRIENIEKLAKKYGAEIVASRKVVDEGLIDYEKQVGLTGKIISPAVYVAFGISGEIQHIVGIENSTTVIAINKDKDAKIFGYSDYGILCTL